MNKSVVHRLKLAAYLSFSVGLAFACYFRPSPDDFDRYIYESLIRSRTQALEDVYRIIKHESPRAEASSVLDSPGHLAQLGPLYAIRPLYLLLTGLLAEKLSPQQAINLVSAGSLFLIGLVVFVFTRNYLYSALLLLTPGLVTIGRIGTPDALSTMMLAAGCAGILKEKLAPGILLLMISIWVRTDNVLFVLAVLGWLVWSHKVPRAYAGILAGVAIGSVKYINYFSRNYGWKVLMHYSFVGGRYPAEMTTGITVSQYVHVFATNAESLLPQLAPFLLLGTVAWKMNSSSERKILVPVAAAAIARYCLFPSGEARYFAWACIITGMIFVRSIQERHKTFMIENRTHAAAA
ncbi:MAG: hypothetical protein DMG93_06700 [Acidobacteria bacterium]|nr:MAG: hypothetical protein DMG93_06700 [Acidobacteriota bacterium]